MNSTLRLTLKVVVVLALAGAAVVGHRSETVALHFVGSFCGLLGLALLVSTLLRRYHAADETAWSGHVRRYLPPLLVVGVAMAVLAPLLTGQMPLSHDHPVHLYKAWHFWEEMLLDGRLRGWSSYWFFGYPAEELYPIGPDIWVALFRLVTLGLVSWETTYGLAFVGCVRARRPTRSTASGRRYFGAHGRCGRRGALDPGLRRLPRGRLVLHRGLGRLGPDPRHGLRAAGPGPAARTRSTAGSRGTTPSAALLFAAALLSHPMNVIVFGVGHAALPAQRAGWAPASPSAVRSRSPPRWRPSASPWPASGSCR